MGDERRHSLVLAAEYPVSDIDEMWTQLQVRKSHLADIDAHHIVVYSSMWGPRRALVTVGLRRPDSVREILRSPIIFELFDIAGCDEIPAMFAGELVEQLDLHGAERREGVAGVIVGVVTLDDVAELIVKVRAAADRFQRAGVRKLWMYSALDDGREVMILQEIADEITARRWRNHPDSAAEWMTNVGAGGYPKLFVGRLAHLMAVDAQAERAG